MMEQWLVDHEIVIRGYTFYSMLALMVLWESLKPAKPPTTSTPLRWLNNVALLVINNLLMRLVYPAFAVVFSVYIASRGFGLFNLLDMSLWLVLPLTVIMLDFAAYVVHWLLHKVPWLWRLHRIHHTDLDYDVTTGLRFHPLESAVTMGSQLLMIAVLGTQPVAVVVYEFLFVSTALFNHGNIHLPASLDRLLRTCIVTPDMHRIHHSIDTREGNSNFAGIFSVWDRMFGTYCKEPAAGQDGMVMGLAEYRDARSVNLHRLLIMPFVNTSPTDTSLPDGVPAEPGNTSP